MARPVACNENTPDVGLRSDYAERGLSAEQIDVALPLRTWLMNDLDARL